MVNAKDTTAGITRIDDLLDFDVDGNGHRQIGVASEATGLLTTLTNYNPQFVDDYLTRNLIHSNTVYGGMVIKQLAGIQAKAGIANPNANNLNNTAHWSDIHKHLPIM